MSSTDNGSQIDKHKTLFGFNGHYCINKLLHEVVLLKKGRLKNIVHNWLIHNPFYKIDEVYTDN